jgi:hypothetical protein
MYDEVNTTNTCAWINAIAISNPQKAIIKDKGSNPIKKKINPLVIILYVNPLKIANRRCPETIFAASLKPKDTALDKYETNSIKTNNGSKPRGQPAGTKSEKNSNPCFWNPSIVAPKTIVKLIENVNMK